MEHVPSPRELRGAARACTFLAYATGIAGVAGGTLVLRDGDVPFAILLYIVTFAVGASLMGVAVLVRAIAGLSARASRIEHQLDVVVGDRSREHGLTPPDQGRDPWLRH